MERPGSTREPGSELQRVSHQGTISVCHLLSPLCCPRGTVGDGARCRLRLCSPEKYRCVTFNLRCHILMEVSGKKEPQQLCYNPHLTCSYEMKPHVKQTGGGEGWTQISAGRQISPSLLLPKLLSASVSWVSSLALLQNETITVQKWQIVTAK